MTVAQVHPTLLENNGYKTTPIKTTFSQNHVKYQHWWQLVNQVFLTQRRSVPPAAEQWRSSGVSDGRYSVVKVKAVLGGSRWQMHTPTHIMWILGNQNEEQEGGGVANIAAVFTPLWSFIRPRRKLQNFKILSWRTKKPNISRFCGSEFFESVMRTAGWKRSEFLAIVNFMTL